MKNLNILCTSVGNDGFIAIYKALKMSSRTIKIFGADCDSLAYGLVISDQSFVISKRSEPKVLLEELKTIIVQNNINILYPLSTEDQSFYSYHIDFFIHLNCQVIVSDHNAVEICNNKHELYRYLSACDVPIPAFRIVKDKESLVEALRDFDAKHKPVVLKKKFSTGAQGVKIVFPTIDATSRFFSRDYNPIPLEDLYRWIDIIDSIPDLMLSEYLPGLHISADVFLQDKLSQICVLRTEEKHLYGMATYGKTIKLPELMITARKIAELVGLNYTVNVEFKFNLVGQPMLMEINPRLPASIDHTVKAGCNMPLWNVLSVLNEKIEFNNPLENLQYWRCWDSVVK